jgi:hypothetical protein
MKKTVYLLLLIPSLCFSQIKAPKFEHDTLYSTCGYNLYKGQQVHILNGSAKKKFRFLRSIDYSGYLNDLRLTITDIKNYSVSSLGNGYITFVGSVTFKDGSKGRIKLKMNFERAMRPFADFPSEIEVPEQYRAALGEASSGKTSVADEIRKLKELLDEGAITREEFDTQKKKLLNQ